MLTVLFVLIGLSVLMSGLGSLTRSIGDIRPSEHDPEIDRLVADLKAHGVLFGIGAAYKLTKGDKAYTLMQLQIKHRVFEYEDGTCSVTRKKAS